mgnify:CR=1 FL=1
MTDTPTKPKHLSVEKVNENSIQAVKNELSEILSESVGDITITDEDLASVLPDEKALERKPEDLLMPGYTVSVAGSVNLITDG